MRPKYQLSGIVGAFVMIFTLSNCASDVNYREIIDEKAALKLYIKDSTKKTINGCEMEIQVDSDKYKKLLSWADRNTEGWSTSFVSYAQSDILVSQNSFRLLYWRGGKSVVIGFLDNKNQGKQYAKTINKGELDFLANEK